MFQANANPIANFEVAKYALWPTPSLSIPVMISSGLPVLRAGDADDVIASILSESGGILNGRIGLENVKVVKRFWPGSKVYGALADFYAGGKVTDAAGADGTARDDAKYIGLFEGRANLRLVLPITESARASYDPSDLRGTLHVRLQTAYSRSPGDTYRTMLDAATLLDADVWSSSVAATLVITDVIYLETGWIFHVSDPSLAARDAKRVNFAVRLLR